MTEARTIAEAYMYLELTAPPGESWVDYRRYTTLHSVNGNYILRFDGPHEGRRHIGEVTIPHASHRAAEESEQLYGEGRSTLIDAGQWYVLEAAYAGMAQTGLDQLVGAAPDEQTYWAIVEAWDGAAAAAVEIEKFLPPDVEDVPAEAFWTEHGRRVRGQRRDAFRRSRLASAQAFYRRQLDDFRSRFPVPGQPGVELPAPRQPADSDQGSGALPARTYGEAHVYMDLHPCGCGSAQFPRGQMVVLSDDERGATVQYAGPCDECARPREFTFRLTRRRGLPPESPYRFSYLTDGPSELLDPGDWVAVSEGYAVFTDVLAGLPDPAHPTDQEDVVKILTCAASALDEALKFFRPGADALSPAAFWTEAGREFYHLDPDRFRRLRLEELRAERWRRLAEFTAGHGR